MDRFKPDSATDIETTKRLLPWIVATALLMQQLDSTIVNTALPAMAESLSAQPLELKAVVTSYILTFAVGIPISGWMADRFGTRRVFGAAIGLFTLASVLCGLSVSTWMLVASRALQGVAAAMMMPVGRLAIIRTFRKEELLHTLNFIVLPALIGPLLGPTVGGLIVHWMSWRVIFLINIPIGLVALWLAYKHMPDYRAQERRPLDLLGLVLFGGGLGLLSWLLEIFGEHLLSTRQLVFWAIVSFALLCGYVVHANNVPYPLLRLSVLKTRTFAVAVGGGFVTRLGLGGVPFLMPLLYQVGLGLPAWQSGLMMMPTALAAMSMKMIAEFLLKRFGYRKTLIVNTVLAGCGISAFSLVTSATPIFVILLMAFCVGFFNSLQFSAMNSLAYADVEEADSSMAATIASSFQQMSLSFGMACGALVTGYFLGSAPQSDQAAFTSAIHHAYITLGLVTILSSAVFWTLYPDDGRRVSGMAPVNERAEAE